MGIHLCEHPVVSVGGMQLGGMQLGWSTKKRVLTVGSKIDDVIEPARVPMM